MLMRNISNGSSLVVIRNFHSFSVFLVGQGFNLLFEKVVLFHLVKGPGRTNCQNVGAFIRAFLLVVVVSNETGLVGFDRSGAVSGEGLNLELRDGRDRLSVDGAFVSGIFKGIVVAGVKVVFSRDSGWVRYVEGEPSFSELMADGDAIGGGDLLEGEGVDGSDCSFEGGWVDEGILMQGVSPLSLWLMQGLTVPQISMRGEVLWTAGVGPLGYSDIDDNKYRASTRQTHPKSMLYPTYSIYIYRKGPFNSRILPFYFLPLSVRLVVYKLNRMNHNNYDYLFKYIVVGDASVGKSCIILRYTQQLFKNDHEPTLGVEFASKIVNMDDLTIKTQIWDTAGQQSFKAITRSYYKGSIAVFLIFDITNKSSFDSLHKWLFQIKNHSHDRVEIVLLGNKADVKSKRQVTFDQAQTFAKNNGFKYYQVSALTGQRVFDVFEIITKTILNKVLSKELNTDGQTSLGVRKGKKQKKEIITRVSSGFNETPDRKTGCCN